MIIDSVRVEAKAKVEQGQSMNSWLLNAALCQTTCLMVFCYQNPNLPDRDFEEIPPFRFVNVRNIF